MRVLVVGFGSIGQRHTRLLVEAGCRVAVVSRRPIGFSLHYDGLSQALIDWKPDYVVVANRTSEHRGTMETLIEHDFHGRLLLEKPLFDRTSSIPRHDFSLVVVAYNLRCHPLLKKLKSFLDDSTRLCTANVYAGSYLPDWRPQSDYRESYSARRDQGGGVLRDLSHEFDYALWLFGPWQRLTASGGRMSHLAIDSDDAYSVLAHTGRCPLVSIHVNYLDRIPRREIVVNTDRHTVHVDLIKNTMVIDGIEESVDVTRDDTYRAEHRAMLSGDATGLCTLEEAQETLRTIEAAERAGAWSTWIER